MRFQLLNLPLATFACCAAAQPQLEIDPAPGFATASIRVSGEPDTDIVLESSSDLNSWQPLQSGAIQLDGNGYAQMQLAFSTSAPVFVRAYEDSDLPLLYRRFADRLDVYLDGNYIVIETDNIPDHPSPYFGIGDSRYEAYNGSNSAFRINPNRISAQSYTFRIPISPTEASSKQSTRLGPIGIALNGVALFNQYAGPNQPLTSEINSFDQYNGHPTGANAYHYHVEPTYLTTNKGRATLIGVLLDGFPVYGPEEDGKILTSSDLDSHHGHFGPTPEFPEGIYHYHFTGDAPYLNGGQYFGTPGTQTN